MPVETPDGSHTRPTAELAQRTTAYSATVTVHIGDREADAKSVLSLLTLGINSGAWISLSARGIDAAQAVSDPGRRYRAHSPSDGPCAGPHNPLRPGQIRC